MSDRIYIYLPSSFGRQFFLTVFCLAQLVLLYFLILTINSSLFLFFFCSFCFLFFLRSFPLEITPIFTCNLWIKYCGYRMEIFGHFNDIGGNGNAMQRAGHHCHGNLCCLWNICYTKGKSSLLLFNFNYKNAIISG